jgi:hypothetical protein
MSNYRTCGACYESVHKYASVCPHCQTRLVPEPQPGTPGLKDWLLFFVLFGVVFYFLTPYFK